MTYVGVVGLGRGMVTGGSIGLSMGWSFVAAGLVYRLGDVIDNIENYIDGELPELPFAKGEKIGTIINN